jgi:hypothetical protein
MGPSGKGLKGSLAFEDKGKTLYHLSRLSY